jgi:hypothetical protein
LRHVAACTIVARNYLAHAKTLIDSYFRQIPEASFYLLIVDGAPPPADIRQSVRVLGPADLNIQGFRELSFKYDVTELCTAVKPALLRYVLAQSNVDAVLYFDPDILIFRDLTELWSSLETSDIVLIPHLLDPIPVDGFIPDEQFILAAGAYNLGFLALNASPETDRLLEWWQERLKDNCRIDIPRALFVDQKWMDLVPGLFSSTTILRDDTYDVAYWNLHSRQLSHVDTHFLINGRELSFFHFSGYNPATPRELSKHQNRLSVVDGSALATLLDIYAEELRANGYLQLRDLEYGYAKFDNGVEISPLHRRLYQNLGPMEKARVGDPFATGRKESFFNMTVPRRTPRALLRRVLPQPARPLLRAVVDRCANWATR